MSMQSWEITASPSADEALEAMFLAGGVVMRGRRRFLQIVHALFFGFFAPLGATMVVWIAVQMLGGPKQSAMPVFAVPLTLLAFGWLSLWLMKRIYYVVAQVSAGSKFGRMQQVTIDGDGVTQVTQHSRWHSGWADIAAVRGGKTTITIAISGIAVALPRSAFPNPPEADRALAAMQSWQEAAQ